MMGSIRRGRPILRALVFLVVVSLLSALCVAAASPKKGGNTILLFLGTESDDRDAGVAEGEDNEPLEQVETEVEDASPEWDEFSDTPDAQHSDEDLDPGSWIHVLEQPSIWDTRNQQVLDLQQFSTFNADCSLPRTKSNMILLDTIF